MRFKVVCFIFILLLVGGIINSILFSTNDCGYNYYYYRSCSSFYSSQVYECTNYNIKYCCSSSYSMCGDMYCLAKPFDYYAYSYYYSCYGFSIVMGILYGLAFIAGVIISVMVCNFRNRAREENIKRFCAPNVSVPQNPPIYYAPYQQPQQPVAAQKKPTQQPNAQNN